VAAKSRFCPASAAGEPKGEPLLMDAVDQAQRDLQEALAAAGAALERAVETYALLCALAGVPAAPDLDEPFDLKRRYRRTGNEDWWYVEHAAAELGVHRETCWRWAAEHWAQWPYKAQRVDFNRLRHLRPPGAKNAKIAK
jgi:hypothetical protein